MSYNGNGGSGSTAAETKQRYYNNGNIADPTFTVKSNGFSNSGKLFQTWRLNGISGDAYAPNTTITLSANATLYAIWVASTLTVFSKSGIQTVPRVYDTSYVTLNGSFAGRTDAPGIEGSCYGYIWYVSGTSSASGSVTVKVPAPYTKATITMINHINNLNADGDDSVYGSASISGSFGTVSRSVKGWTDNTGNFTGTATGNSLTLNASASVTKRYAESWAEFGWYISSIVLS